MKTIHTSLSLICLASLALFALPVLSAEKSGVMKLNPDVKLVIDGNEHFIRSLQPAVPNTLSPAMKNFEFLKRVYSLP